MGTNKIGSVLRELRGKKTQAVVARDIGISVSAYTMYEIGQRVPKDEIKVKIANYYNTTVQSIFFDSK